MCGIAGLLQLTSRFEQEEMGRFAQAMGATLRHRGPDAGGVWVDDRATVALAHRRLAIVELSSNGAQPMLGPEERIVLTFNGEIYNHAELRRELQDAGRSFRGRSDTEVLVTGIETWGLEHMLRKAVGMFAFAAWDRLQRRLWLARDRLGEKPLYYGAIGGAWAFASELKALRLLPGWDGGIDNESLSLYLRYGYVPGPRSIYQGIYKLPPGSWLELSTGVSPHSHSPFPERQAAAQPKYYWFPQRAVGQPLIEKRHRTDEELRAELDGALRTAVGRQMEADVPLGAFLSGGIDSSVVAAIMQQLSSRPINTYTISFADPEYNEAAHASAVAEHLGTDHTELHVTSRMALDMVSRIPRVYDEPFADASQVPMMLLAQMAKEHVTVCLAGDGGDELFCGYNRYTYADRIWRWHGYPRLRHLAAQLIDRLPESVALKLYQGVTSMDRQPIALGGQNYRGRLAKLARALEADSLAYLYRSLVSYWHHPSHLSPVLADFPEDYLSAGTHGFAETALDRMMRWDLLAYLPDDSLVKGDRATMASSVELRLPLLDHSIVELSQSIPVQQKIKGGYSKWPLRQVLYQYVPAKLVNRPKMGFSAPVGAWLRAELKEWAAELLAPEALEKTGSLNAHLVQRIWSEHLQAKADHSQRLWCLLMLQEWLADQGAHSKFLSSPELVNL